MCFSVRKYNFLFPLLFLLFLNNKEVNVNMRQKSNYLMESEENKTNPIEIPEKVNNKSNVKVKKIRITVKTIKSIEILLA